MPRIADPATSNQPRRAIHEPSRSRRYRKYQQVNAGDQADQGVHQDHAGIENIGLRKGVEVNRGGKQKDEQPQ